MLPPTPCRPQAALAKERARSAAIADALRTEADAKHAEAAQRLEKQVRRDDGLSYSCQWLQC